MSNLTFEQRCKTMQQCLPDAPYRGMLTVLHIEMLAELKRLMNAEAEWAARSQDDGKAQGEIDRLRAALESESVGYQAELAGYEHTIGHLSALVDELRAQQTEKPAMRGHLTTAEIEQLLARWDYHLHGDRARYLVREAEKAHGITKGGK